MNHYFLQRAVAEYHVESYPGDGKPACPIVAAQQEHSAHDGNYFRDFDQRIVGMKCVTLQNRDEMTDKASCTDQQIQAGDNCYRDGALIRQQRSLSLILLLLQQVQQQIDCGRRFALIVVL
jgi:hypothetical protein